MDFEKAQKACEKHAEEYEKAWSVILVEEPSSGDWRWSVYHGHEVAYHGRQLSFKAAATCAEDKLLLARGSGQSATPATAISTQDQAASTPKAGSSTGSGATS